MASISVTSLGGGDPGLRPCSGETRTAAISPRLARMHARERGDLVRLRLGLRLRARARAGVRVGMRVRSRVRSRRRHVKQRQRIGHLPLVAHPRLHAIPPPVVRALELDDQRLARVEAREAHRAHDRLGAAHVEGDLVQTGDPREVAEHLIRVGVRVKPTVRL